MWNIFLWTLVCECVIISKRQKYSLEFAVGYRRLLCCRPHCDFEMKNSNKSTVPMLWILTCVCRDFVSWIIHSIPSFLLTNCVILSLKSIHEHNSICNNVQRTLFHGGHFFCCKYTYFWDLNKTPYTWETETVDALF